MISCKQTIFLRLNPNELTMNILLSVSLALLLILSSCTNQESVSFVTGSAKIRVFSAQTRTDLVNIQLDSVEVISSLNRGNLSLSAEVDSDYGREIAADFIGGDSTFNIPRQRFVFANNQSYTVVLNGNTIAGFMKPIIDTTISPFGQEPAIRIINTTESKYVLVSVNQDTLSKNEIEFGSNTQLFKTKAGTFGITAFDTENNDTLTTITSTLQAGKCYHLFLYDTKQQDSPQALKLVEVVK